jgi:tetratricopeptide (TPR) repeat protein
MGEDTLRGLDELVTGSAEEVTRRLFERTLAAAAPPLRDLLELCALPEAFDPAIIGVLRDRPDETEANAQLFQTVQGYPFVEAYDDDTAGYHDLLRPYVHARLQQTRPEDVARINERLGPVFRRRGEDWYRTQQFARAVVAFSRAIATNYSAVAEAYLWRGRAFMKLVQTDDAIRDFAAAIERDPQQSEHFFRRASALIERGRYRDAIADLDRAIGLQPGRFPKNFLARGTAHYRLGNNQQALADFERAVALIELIDEASEQREDLQERALLDQALESRGIVLVELRRYEAALNDFERATSLNAESSSHHFWCGLAHYYLNQHGAAADALGEALRLNRDNHLFLRWRGVVYTKLERYAEAQQDFRRAIALDDQQAINYYWLGYTQFHVRAYQAALDSFAEAIGRADALYPAYRWRGVLLYGLGDIEGAQVDFDRAISGLPRDPKLRQERGAYIFLEALADLDQAEADFRAALALSEKQSDTHATVHFWLSQVYVERGAFPEALNHLQIAVEQNPLRTRNLCWRGVAFERLGEIAAAEQDWAQTEQLARKEPRLWQRYTRLAWLALLRDGAVAAQNYFRQALDQRADYFPHDLRYQHATLRRLMLVYPDRSEFAPLRAWFADELAVRIPRLQ